MADMPKVASAASKKERPFLGHAVVRGSIRYLSAKAILEFDDRHSGCPRKWANAKLFGRKLARPDYLDEGVSLAEITEHYLTTSEMVLPPVLQPAVKFFPNPRNDNGELDLICERPIGDIEAAVRLRDLIIQRPKASNLSAALQELDRLAGLTARGIPFDGAADWVHFRNTYKDKDGLLRSEARGLRVVGIGDLKSISLINTHVTPSSTRQGWAQTDIEVCSDPQMLAYAKRWLKDRVDATHARTEKVYAQKKSHAAEIRGGLVSRQQVDDRWGELEERIVDEMIQTASATKIEDVRYAVGSCQSYTHLVSCGYPGCGVGCDPGKSRSKDGTLVLCAHCKGKAKKEKGCGYRGTASCPIPESIQIPLVNISLDRSKPQTGEPGMSLFDRAPSSPMPPAPSSPMPPAASSPMPPAPSPLAADTAAYRDQVAAEMALLEARMRGEQAPFLPSSVALSSPAPVPPSSPASVDQAVVGDKIQVAFCAPGDDYMVDCGGRTIRMRFLEVSAGIFRFESLDGGRVDLDVRGFVWRLPPGAPPASVAPSAKRPCGAPGCGEGCEAGKVMNPQPPGSTVKEFSDCPACAGRGAVSFEATAVKPPDAPRTPWIDQQMPLSDDEIGRMKADPGTDPRLLELVVEHKRLVEERDRAAAEAQAGRTTTKGGNCPGSGQVVVFSSQPSVVDGKIVCPLCGTAKTIPKEVRKAKAVEMPFPPHRRPKEDSKSQSPHATPIPPVPPSPPAATIAEIKTASVGVAGGESLTSAEVDVIANFFGDRAKALRPSVSAPVESLFKRLRLID